MPAPRGASDDLNLRMQGAPSSNGCRLLGRGLHECPRQPSFDIARPAADNKLFFFNTEAVVRRLRSLDISSATVSIYFISDCFHAPTIRRHTSSASRANTRL